MIDKKDLHIGCWYNFKNPMNGSLVPVIFSNWSEGLDFEAYGEPIKLTPDWVENKFGFHNDEITYTKDIIMLAPCVGGVNLYINTLTYGKVRDLKIEYVHQLQNLYFALTGKELTIKEAEDKCNLCGAIIEDCLCDKEYTIHGL